MTKSCAFPALEIPNAAYGPVVLLKVSPTRLSPSNLSPCRQAARLREPTMLSQRQAQQEPMRSILAIIQLVSMLTGSRPYGTFEGHITRGVVGLNSVFVEM